MISNIITCFCFVNLIESIITSFATLFIAFYMIKGVLCYLYLIIIKLKSDI